MSRSRAAWPSTRKRWASIPSGIACVSSSFRPATAPPIWSSSTRRPSTPRVLRRCSPTHSVVKIFHFARFDLAVLEKYLGVSVNPVYCTKIVSKLVRTYTDRHGLKDLTAELLGIELSKQQQSSDWAAATLSQQQLAYAAADVLHLHALKAKLDAMLEREGRGAYAKAAFEFLPTRAKLDLAGYGEDDIFAH